MLKQIGLLLSTLAGSSLLAQNFGEITGSITDASGSVMPGAVITVVSRATNQVRSAVANDAGIYSFPSLVPGLYDIRAEKPGFKLGVRRDIELEVGAVS